MTTITLSSKNQMVLPEEARKKLNVKSGDKLVVSVTDDCVLITKQPSIADFMGILGPSRGDPVQRIRKLRDEWDESVR